MRAARVFALSASATIAMAQVPTAPVVNPRGVLNAYTLLPAPSRVARGGLVQISGLNLGPAAGVTAAGLPWPVTVGSPEIQVLINGTAVPIFSAAPDQIVAQVP
ncbi:MAG: hypothetical protein ABIZ80_10400, partial [Bryobacteraceae bacterium]